MIATPPADLEAVDTVAGAATDNNNNTVTAAAAAAEAESVDAANSGSNDVMEGDKSPINIGGDTDKDILANAPEIADEPCEMMKVTNSAELTPEDRVPSPSSPAMCQTANVRSSSSTNIRSGDLRCLETENTSSVTLTSVTEITESSTQINVTQSWQEGTTSDRVSLYPEDDVRQGVTPQFDGEMSTSVESAETPNLGSDLTENFTGQEVIADSSSSSPAAEEEVPASPPTIPVKSGQEASINETFMGGEELGRECREECAKVTTEKVDKMAIYGNKTDAEISDSPSALSNQQKQSAQENCKLIVCR